MSVSRQNERQPLPINPADLDPAVQVALGNPAGDDIYDRIAKVRRMTPSQRRKAQKDRERHKETFDLPAWQISAIQTIAQRYDVPKSNVVAHLITSGIHSFLSGQINFSWLLKPSRSPRYLSLLHPPEEIDLIQIKQFMEKQK